MKIEVAQIVALLAWISAFLSLWRCWIYDKWMPFGLPVIVFSVIVALVAGLLILTPERKGK